MQRAASRQFCQFLHSPRSSRSSHPSRCSAAAASVRPFVCPSVRSRVRWCPGTQSVAVTAESWCSLSLSLSLSLFLSLSVSSFNSFSLSLSLSIFPPCEIASFHSERCRDSRRKVCRRCPPNRCSTARRAFPRCVYRATTERHMRFATSRECESGTASAEWLMTSRVHTTHWTSTRRTMSPSFFLSLCLSSWREFFLSECECASAYLLPDREILRFRECPSKTVRIMCALWEYARQYVRSSTELWNPTRWEERKCEWSEERSVRERERERERENARDCNWYCNQDRNRDSIQFREIS